MKRQADRVISAGQAVRAALSASVRRLASHQAAVLRGRSPEAVHQARVAVRRLRSDLRSFRPLVDRLWSDPLRQELRWLGRELGTVRDLDVFIARLRCDAPKAGEDRAGVGAVIDAVTAERRDAHRQLVATMRSQRYGALRVALRDAAMNPPLTLAIGLPSRVVLAPTVRKRWKKLSKAVKALSGRPSAASLHRIRILAKRCRYAAEAAQIGVGKEAEEFADAAADLQDALGELNDAVTACAKLRRLGRRQATARGVKALLPVERDAAAKARKDWPDSWCALDDKRLRAWF